MIWCVGLDVLTFKGPQPRSSRFEPFATQAGARVCCRQSPHACTHADRKACGIDFVDGCPKLAPAWLLTCLPLGIERKMGHLSLLCGCHLLPALPRWHSTSWSRKLSCDLCYLLGKAPEDMQNHLAHTLHVTRTQTSESDPRLNISRLLDLLHGKSS